MLTQIIDLTKGCDTVMGSWRKGKEDVGGRR